MLVASAAACDNPHLLSVGFRADISGLWWQLWISYKWTVCVDYLIYVSMRHYVLTTSGDIVVCFHTAVWVVNLLIM